MSNTIAAISVATGIAPNDLIAAPPLVLDMMVQILHKRQRQG